MCDISIGMTTATGFHRKRVRQKELFSRQLNRLRDGLGISLAKVEEEIKIRESHLAHIEAGEFHHLPPSHARGFIRRYARFLGVDDAVTEAELVYIDTARRPSTLFSPGRIGRESRWIITPRTIVLVILAICVVGLLGYVTYQVRQFSAPPVLQVLEPNDHTVVKNEQLTVRGSTQSGSTVTIDELQANVAIDGAFSQQLTLRPGLNQITIRSVNRIKKVTEKTVTILYELPVSPSPLPSVSPTTQP